MLLRFILPRAWRVCAALAFCVVVLTAGVAQGVPLRLSARTQLLAAVAAEGAVLRVEGRLVDSVARGVVGGAVDVRVTGPGDPMEERLYTDDRGSFALQRPLPDGQWHVALSHPGSDYHSAATASASVTTTLGPAEVACSAAPVLLPDERVVHVTCEARFGSVGVPASAIALTDDCGAVRLDSPSLPVSADAAETGEGSGARVIPFELPAGPVDCAIEARVEPTAHHAGGHDVVRVRAMGTPIVSATANEIALAALRGPRFVVVGRVEDALGPVEGVDVVAQSGAVELGRARTGRDGFLSLEIDLRSLDVGPQSVVVALVSAIDGHVLAEGSVGWTLERRPTADHIVVGVAAIGLVLASLALTLALGGFGSLRRWFVARREKAASAPVTRIDTATDVVAAGDAVLLQVHDAATGRRIDDAVARMGELVFASEGPGITLRGPTLEALRVEAPGYVARAVERRMLRPGDVVRVRLDAVRVVVRDILHALLDQLELEQAELRWGRATVGQLRRVLRDRLRALAREREPMDVVGEELEWLEQAALEQGDTLAAAEALALLLDAVWWSPTAPTEAAVERARALAALVLGSRGAP